MAYLRKILKEDEEAIRVVRRYPISFGLKIILALLFIALPFFLMMPLFRWGNWGLLLFSLLLLFAFLYALRVFIVWYFNLFIITNQRVIDVYQKGFFDRTVSSAAYNRIRDVAYRTKGLMQMMFHYGTVIIEISGVKVRLEIKNIKNPQEIQEIITGLGRHSQATGQSAEFHRLTDELREPDNQGVDIPIRVKKE
ncbi:MAG: PH domain-containing protein [bacterium]